MTRRPIAGLILSLFLIAGLGCPAVQAAPKHALAKIAATAVAPVAHPKRTLKQTFGVIVFGVETVNDGALAVLTGADKAFDAISIQGRFPVVDGIYAFVGVAQKDSAKFDVWLERQEKYLFGTSN